ncbi:MAG: hypothetical protein NUK65_06060 [Firmicutes bacterium]|nr:hypothetical protein [Bacillota bacterium]
MFSIISTSELYEDIKTVVEKRGSVLYEKVTEGEDIIKAFDEAGRVNSSVLVLDIDAGAGIDLVKGVKKFKVARPHTRIVLLAPGRKPGDQVISQLLAKGVYDIVAPNIPEEGDLQLTPILNDVLDRESATYGDAVRWDVDTKIEEQETQKQTVYMEKLIGTGFICVVGSRRGVGCTTMAVAIANYLAAEAKKKVALVELTHYPVLHWVGKLHKNVDVFTQGDDEHFNPYQECIKNLLENVAYPEFDFVVLDLGVVFEPETDKESRKDMRLLRVHEYRGEILRADLTVMVTGSGPWDYLYLEPYLRNMEKALGNWTVVTVGDPGKNMRGMIEEKTERVIVAPYVSGAFSSELQGTLEELLAVLIPQSPEKKTFGLWR